MQKVRLIHQRCKQGSHFAKNSSEMASFLHDLSDDIFTSECEREKISAQKALQGRNKHIITIMKGTIS
jgi:hypothetical protein